MVDEPQLVRIDDVQAWQLREQIEVRRKLLGQMVGWLYTRVLDDEISKLAQRLTKYKDVVTILRSCRA